MRSSSSILWGTILVVMYSLTSHAMDKKTDQKLKVSAWQKHFHCLDIEISPVQKIDFVYPPQVSSEYCKENSEYFKRDKVPTFHCCYNLHKDTFHAKDLRYNPSGARKEAEEDDPNSCIPIECTRDFVKAGVKTYESLITSLGRKAALIALFYSLPIMSVDALQSPRRAPATRTGWCFINRTFDYNKNDANFYSMIQYMHRDTDNTLYALNANDEAIIWDLNSGKFQIISSSHHSYDQTVNYCTDRNRNSHGVDVSLCHEKPLSGRNQKRLVFTKYAAIVASTANEIYQKILEHVENNTCRSLFCCRRSRPKTD